MYRISRIRMSGVGPPDARFDRPSPDSRPFEVECLGPDGYPTDTVVWLENGGGKTVLLALLFHVLSPRQAPQIGNDHRGRRGDIGDFVLAGDVAHVVIEWTKDEDGSEKLVTGLVAERRGSSVNRTWYLLTLRGDLVGLDDLVFDQDGRRVSAAAYLESLEHLASQSGKSGRRNRVELARTTTQRIWLETLANHQLDPALFEYQVRMNKAEGGATTLFQFKSSDEFIEFFIELTMNQETLDSLSQTLSKVAEKVAALPQRELALAHAKGAAQHLELVASGWNRYLKADEELKAWEAAAGELYDQLVAAIDVNRVEEVAAKQKAEDLAEAARKADKERQDAKAYARHVDIAAADARIREYDSQIEEAKADQDDVELTWSAWPRLGLAIRRERLQGEIQELERARQEADEDAAPLLEHRDRLGRRLRELYEDRLEGARGSYKQAVSDVEAAESELGASEELRQEAESRIGRAEGQARELIRQIDRYESSLAAAVAGGVLDEGADPGAALETAAAELTSVTARTEEETERRRRELASRTELREAAHLAASQARTALSEADRLQQIAAGAQEERDRLASHPLLAQLGAEDVDLELVGSEVVRLVEAEAERRSSELVETAVESAEDRRAVDSLEREQLLPSRAEVDSLCALLKSKGVDSATPGWRYIAQALSHEERLDAIATNPAVVDGIVVAGNDLDRVRELLAEVAPASAVAVAVTSVVADKTPPRSQLWVVPPDPAMYDPSEAEPALARRREQLEKADEREAEIKAKERTARELSASLRRHLEAWPPDTLPAAQASAQSAQEKATLAFAHSEETAARLEAVEKRIEDIDAELEELRSVRSSVEQRHSKLAHLAEEAERITAVRGQVTEANTARTQAVGDRDQASEMAAQAKERRQRASASMKTAEKTVEAAERALGELPDLSKGPKESTGSLEELRSRYEEAVRSAEKATTESELSRRLDQLQRERQQTEQDWSGLEENLRRRVTELMDADAATDPTSRMAAEAEAETAARQAREKCSALRAQRDIVRQRRKALPDPERSVDTSGLPTGAEELEALSRDAELKHQQARDRRSQVDEARQQTSEAHRRTAARLQAIETQLESLRSATGARGARPAPPFTGDAADAVRRVLAQSRHARQQREEAEKAWREAASRAGVFAQGEAWESLKGDLPRRLRTDSAEQLASSAEELLTQTRLLADRLEDEIAKLDVHRQLLVTSLADAVSEARRSLNQAQSKSTLPQGLGEWSNHPFLKIRLSVPTDLAELDSRLRRFTNDLLERENIASAGLPTGALLVRQAVLACADRTVTVDVLKPNKAQRLRYEPITEMATLSGGMRATAAIAMFCTLARVRAINQTGKAGVGTLVLDNPIGDANATYLVNLQRQVARMSDVQLLYTTGVNDMDALRLFPNRVRLTNEAAKRSHLAYVVGNEAFLKSLAPSEGDHALVTGTRLTKRQDPLFTVEPERRER